MIRIILLSVLLFLVSVTAGADSLDLKGNRSRDFLQDEILLTYAGSALWSLGYEIKIEGNYAFCGMVNGIQVLDISDPSNPQIVSQVYLNSQCRAVEIVDSTLYVGCIDLKIYDISNPISIKQVGVCETEIGIFAIKVIDDYAYIHCQSGFHIIDVSNPASCKPVAFLDLPISIYSISDVDINGNFAYLATNNLHIIDISNPKKPIKLSTYETPYVAIGLSVVDTLVYVADLTDIWPADISSLEVINVSNPEMPALISNYDINGEILSIEIVDNCAYIAAGLCGGAIFDISDPLNIFPIGCFSPTGSAGSTAIRDSLWIVINNKPADWQIYYSDICSQSDRGFYFDSLFSSKSDSGLFLIFNISDVNNPKSIGQVNSFGYCHGVCVSGDHAFIMDEMGGIKIVDISAPDTLTLLSRIELPPGTIRSTVNGDMLLIANQHFGLYFVDITDIGNPFVIKNMNVGYVFDVKTFNEYAYITSNNGLSVIDISVPNEPEVIGQCFIPDMAIEVLLDGKYAYVSGRFSGFHVIDILDPYNPIVAAISPEPRWSVNLAKKDSILYSCGDTYVTIYNIKNPLNPIRIGEYASKDIRDMTIIDNYLILGKMQSGIELVNIDNPAMPEHVLTYDTPMIALGIDIKDDYIYIADYSSFIRLRLSTHTDVIDDDKGLLPRDYILFQNYPNPFNPITHIAFELPRRSHVTLNIYNLLGQKVNTIANDILPAGNHNFMWDGTDYLGNEVASGIYFYKLRSDNFKQSKKMILIK